MIEKKVITKTGYLLGVEGLGFGFLIVGVLGFVFLFGFVGFFCFVLICWGGWFFFFFVCVLLLLSFYSLLSHSGLRNETLKESSRVVE